MIKFTRSRAHSTVFRTYFVSYLFMLTIPILTGLISYYVSLNVIKSSAMNASELVLNQSKHILDQRMEEVEHITRNFSLDRELNYVLNEQVDQQNYNAYSLWKIWKDTSAYSLTSSYLKEFYIYLNNYQAVLTPQGVFVRPKDFYDLYYFQNIDYDHWKNELLTEIHQREVLPTQPYVREGRSAQVFAYMQSIPLDSFKHSLGTMVVIIDENELAKLLLPIQQEFGGWAYIIDAKGRKLTSIGIGDDQIQALQMKELSNRNSEGVSTEGATLLISTKSSYNGWTYVVGLPKQIVLHKAYYIAKLTWSVTIITLLLGLFISLLFAYRTSAPINRIFSVFRDHTEQEAIKGKHTMEALHSKIVHMVHSQRSLEEELHRQRPLFEDAFLKRLFRGEFDSAQELKTLLQSLPYMRLHSDAGYVVIVRVDSYTQLFSQEMIHEWNTARLLVKKLLHDLNELFQIHMTDIDSNKSAILIMMPGMQDSAEQDDMNASLATLLKQLYSSLWNEYKISVSVAIGDRFHSVMDISRSFQEAKEALDHSVLLDEGELIWYTSLHKESTTYYYPIDLELRLLNAVRMGERQEVQQLWEQLLHHNFAERQLSAEMVQQLFGELKATCLKLLYHSPFTDQELSHGLKPLVEQLQLSTSLEHFRQDMLELFAQFCSRVVKKKEDNTIEIVHQIVNFLEMNYSDPDMNLSKISGHMVLPEHYISHVFKMHTGENISEVLENIRMKQAAAYLLTSDYTIDDIARLCGYNSAHAFRRAFKRVSGVAPSMYRSTVT